MATEAVELNLGRARLAILPALGGAVGEFSWDLGGGQRRHWLRPYDGSGQVLRTASYPLVPYSNRIRDGKFSFGGKDVSLPLNFPPERHSIHGAGWQAPWQVIEQTPTTVAIEVRNTVDAWPWPWRAVQRFTLSDQAMVMDLEITNEGPDAMPYGLGFHPFFVRTPAATATANVAKFWITDDEVMPVELVDPPAANQLTNGIVADQVPMDNTYAGWDGRAVIRWPEWHAGIAIEAPSPLTFLILFTPPGEDFFCCEPVSTCTDAFNLCRTRDDTGTGELLPGVTQTVTTRLIPHLDESA